MIFASGAVRSVPVLLCSALVAGVAGCGVAGDGRDGAATASDPDAVTVDHQFGSTVIEAVPERVVTVDLQWTDVMLAMGVEPVGYTVDSATPESGMPWQDLPETAEAVPATDGLPIEQISALRPDLILGTFTISDQETYDLLAGVAPTVASPDARQVTPWQDLVTLAGEILQAPEDAAEVIDAVEGEVADTAAQLPGLAGQTFALAQYVVGDSMYVVADEQDGSSTFFRQLGMVLYPPVVAAGEETGEARLNVSVERADLLAADLLAFLVNGGDESDLADIPGFDELPGTVAVLDYATIVALNTPSPGSIRHALRELRPYLEDAAGSGA